MLHLLRFLLLSATPTKAGRIILQIHEQLRFVGVVHPRAARTKKLKGKASLNSTDGAILDTLRSGLRFKNMLCKAFLKDPRDHKVIDVWLIMLIYTNVVLCRRVPRKYWSPRSCRGAYERHCLINAFMGWNTELVKTNL